MNKTIVRLLLIVTVVLIATSAFSATAQRPTPTPEPPTAVPDRDGDGVPDDVDQCISDPGPVSNNGCPVLGEPPQQPPTNTPPVLSAGATNTPPVLSSAPPTFPLSGSCLIGNNQPYNVRVLPSVNSAILQVMQPDSFLWALYIVINDEGESWYYTLIGGYVRTDVVFNNGNCANLREILYLPLSADLTIPAGEIDEDAPPPDDSGCFYYVVIDGNVVCVLVDAPILGANIPGTDGAAPPPDDGFCEYQVIIDSNVICLIDDAIDLAAFDVDTSQLPDPDPETCYRLVIFNGQAVCLVTIPDARTRGTDGAAEGAPDPDDDGCYYFIIYNGQFICLLDDAPVLGIEGEDDPLPQTREHILLARQIGVPASGEPECPTYLQYQFTDLLVTSVVPRTALPEPEDCTLELYVTSVVDGEPQSETDANGNTQQILDTIIFPLGPCPPPFIFEPANNNCVNPYDDGSASGEPLETGIQESLIIVPGRGSTPTRVQYCVVAEADQLICNTLNGNLQITDLTS